MADAVRIRGLRELQGALKKTAGDVDKRLRDELKQAAEPVRADAQGLAASTIGRIGPRWQQMRIGVTSRAVYVAPKARRRGGSPRPNLAGLLMEQAMQPALDRHQETVARNLEAMLDRIGQDNGF